jgi:hypothetical protein
MDWWFVIEALVCVAGGIAVGRWWALGVPLVLTFLLPAERIFPPALPDPYLLLATALGLGLRAVVGPLGESSRPCPAGPS